MKCRRTDRLEMPTLDRIYDREKRIAPYIFRTPVWQWRGHALSRCLDSTCEVWLKLEQLQRSGTFKIRGVVSNLLALDANQRKYGVTAMSAGNHAVAVALGAKMFATSAKVVMQASANRQRVDLVRSFGAEIVFAPDGPTGFAMAEQIAREEGRMFIHPFDGELTALGTATLGLEFSEQVPDLEILLIAVGGGGLAGGAGRAMRLLNPKCRIIGVEPEGADVMRRSFLCGAPAQIDQPKTIADSLAPPMTTSYSYSLCRSSLDDIVTVSDEEICKAMTVLFREMKVAVEPAAAAATAALLYGRVAAIDVQRIGVVVCGSNIDEQTFSALISSA